MAGRLSHEAWKAVSAGHDSLLEEARRALAELPAGKADRCSAEVAASMVAMSLSARAAYESSLLACSGSPGSPSLRPDFCSVLAKWETRTPEERERRAAEAAALLASPGEDG